MPSRGCLAAVNKIKGVLLRDFEARKEVADQVETVLSGSGEAVLSH